MNLTLEQYESLQPICELKLDDGKVAFSTPNRFTRWRVESLFTKEPITIEWLSRLDESSILIDVGANVGMYSIWAARTRGAKVYAFEPEAGNFAILNKNIQINNLSSLVSAYCVGLLDFNGYSTLNLSDTTPGGSCHTVSEEVGFDLKPREAAFKQGCAVSTLDYFCEHLNVSPTHIKIDVDGLEPRVIKGMEETLRSPSCKSLIVELNSNLDEHLAVVEFLSSLGFVYSQHQVDSALRKSGAFKGVGEYVFSRVN